MTAGFILRCLHRPEGFLGGAFLLVVTGLALAASLIYPDDPQSIVGRPLLAPFTQAGLPLGTDRLGRDLAAQLVHGAGVSLLIGLTAMLGALAIGIAVGTTAGFAGGRTDEALMRLTEAFQTVPGFILALGLVSVLGPALSSAVIAIALSAWTGPARVVRAEVLSLRTREFVQAALVQGVPRWRIALRDVLPNALPPVVTLASVIVASAILVEAALSFLGLGDPNRVSWGAMIAEGRPVLRSAPMLSIIPGIAIALTVLAVNLVGEAVNEALAPQEREQR